MVVCNLRFTTFNLGEEVHCPLCNAIFKAETCGFRKCEWMFEGRKKGMGSVDVMSQWMVAGKDYERFNEASGFRTGRSAVGEPCYHRQGAKRRWEPV